METRLIRGSPHDHALIAQHAADKGTTMTEALHDLLHRPADSKGTPSAQVADTVKQPVSHEQTSDKPAPANSASIQERPVEVDHAPKVDPQLAGLLDPHSMHEAIANAIVREFNQLGHSVASMAERLEDIEDVADSADMKSEISLRGLAAHLAGEAAGKPDPSAELDAVLEALRAAGEVDTAQALEAQRDRLLPAPDDEQAKADNPGKPKLLPKAS